MRLIGEGGKRLMGVDELGVTGKGKLGFTGESLLRLTGRFEVPLLPKALTAVLTLAVGIAAVMLSQSEPSPQCKNTFLLSPDVFLFRFLVWG